MRSARSSIPPVIRAFCVPKICIPFALLIWLVALEAWTGWQIGIWTPALLADTVFWFVTVASVSFFGVSKVWNEPDFFKRALLATLGLSFIVEVLNDAFVLPLAAELALIPTVTFLALLQVVSATDPKQSAVHKLCTWILGILGVLLVVQAVVRLGLTEDQLDWGHFAQQAALPLWLLVGVLPFVYAVGLFAAYEQFHTRMMFGSDLGLWGQLRTGFVVVSEFGLRAHGLGSAEGLLAIRLGRTTSAREARSEIAASRRRQQDEDQRRIDDAQRLVNLAGVDGVGDDGARLDQREFNETRRALEWLHTCMMGWYQRRSGERYPTDLLQRLGVDFTRRGLSSPSGIELRVSSDGQSWYAWRRTVTGWCFAVGADGPPPSQWKFDGPEPPAGFPGADPDWGDEWPAGHASPNWMDA
jgi:hypothetical protein